MLGGKNLIPFVLLATLIASGNVIAGIQQEPQEKPTSASFGLLFGDELADTCRAADRKGSHELTIDQVRELAEVLKFLTEMDSNYRKRASAARGRDADTFNGDPSPVDPHPGLLDFVSNNMATLSSDAISSWRLYAKTFDAKRKDFSRKAFSDPTLDTFMDVYPINEIKKSATLGEIPIGQLLALEGQLRFLRRELEVIWLLDVSVNRVIAELPEKDSRRLSFDVLITALRNEELKKRHVIFPETVSEDSPFKQLENLPTAEMQKEYRIRFNWLKNGPDSDRFGQAIKSIQKIRSEHITYQWPKDLEKSLFEAEKRPVFENPFGESDDETKKDGSDFWIRD